MNISHENQHKLQTEYDIFINSHLTSEFNQVPAKLEHSIHKTITDISLSPFKFTIHKAAALHLLARVVSVKCKCHTQCNMRRCHCIKDNVKYMQYCHTV